jgi:hypothetical protein
MAVATMEQVHQRAGEEDKVRQDAERVSPVLRPQKEGGYGEKTDQHPFAATDASLLMLVIMRVFHDSSNCRQSHLRIQLGLTQRCLQL